MYLSFLITFFTDYNNVITILAINLVYSSAPTAGTLSHGLRGSSTWERSSARHAGCMIYKVMVGDKGNLCAWDASHTIINLNYWGKWKK